MDVHDKTLKKFTDTARWLTMIEINHLLEYFKSLPDEEVNKGCINYLNKMIEYDFCIDRT